MYSVEDLLISHGYKVPKHNSSSSGPPARPAPPASPPSYSRHQQLLERPRTVNGFCSYTLNHNHNHTRERSQSRQEGRLHDAEFYDANRSLPLQAKDVSYWRRKGQDFAVLLDYTDYKEAAANGRQGAYVRPEFAGERGPAPLEDGPRTQRPRCRENQLLLPWRTSERKCQSLGAEEWHPAEQRLLSRTPEVMVLPRTKTRTQSLPRMQSNCRQYVPLFHQSTYRAPRWPDTGRPASAHPLSITPKPRFTRPPRPPSYEMHQQIRGSCEMLSGRELTREKTPLPRLRPDSHLDYFAQDCGPPGYIPPPSYKRAPIMEGVCRNYGEVAIDYRYRGDVYQQLHRAPDGSLWCPPPSRQLYPVYMTQDRPGGRLQYLPFDPSSSLTDSDKIRHIRKELPSLTVSEPASGNSAFLPPSLGPSSLVVNDSAYGEFDSDNTRWRRHLHKETVDNIPAIDQNYNRYHKMQQGRATSPFSAFHAPVSPSGLRCKSEQGFLETITQVKQIRPDLGPDNNRNPKRRFSETIFCLVSVPVHTPTNLNKNAPADQNNNEPTTNHNIPNTFAVGLKESRPVRSRSVNQVPIWTQSTLPDISGTSSLRNSKRAPLRKEIIDAWALQANESKEMYSRSWPGNQYRNQETQTGSPLVKSPEPEDKPAQVVPNTSADGTAANVYCLKDQKNLQLSSNSAFSLISPNQAAYKELLAPELDFPLADVIAERQRVSSPSEKCPELSTDSAEHVSFGQFLLKPVDRRPSDYIGELESINKEMEDTISKRANANLSGKGIKKRNMHRSGAQSMEEMHLVKPTYINERSKSFTSAADLDTETSCLFIRPQNIPPSQDISDFTLDGDMTPQDIPVPQESMLRDVGLKVYTETGPTEPAPRSCSVPPFQQLDELSWENMAKNLCNDSHEHKVNRESKTRNSHKHHTSGVSLRICRSRSESSRSSHKRECSPHVNKLNRVKSCPGGNQPTLADEHLESLLMKEKSNSLPAEDLSHLYEVKCAAGIPENESIEQRAARILGISVPVGALHVDQAVEQEVCEREVEEGVGDVEKDLAKYPQSLPLVYNAEPIKTGTSEETTLDSWESPTEELGSSPASCPESVENRLEESAMLSEDFSYVELGESHGKVAIDETASEELILGVESKEKGVIALENNEGIKDEDEVKTEDSEKVEVNDKGEGGVTKTTESGGRRVAPPKPPKPKQRSRLQKPALLPKPRCVPKREVSLPRLSTSMEAADRTTVPDSYDPSRVERV
ncbi:unnamed protein product [Knipowitschia caucasica]|uniref:Uncharacterized protein n=1 Tax=Knipowitschia caucasica TaxID=637954 RepID=A0AAV2L4K2_KNICA